jgi:hypothetical protein
MAQRGTAPGTGYVGLLLAALILVAACGTTGTQPTEEPPWEGRLLAPSEAPAILLDEWAKADNRTWCRPFTFEGDVTPEPGRPRRANFAGGWAVAWDLPSGPGVDPSGRHCTDCGRGAFGIAGTGAEAGPGTFSDWEHRRTFRDGSSVGYGRQRWGEGWLAYLEVAGERCLYNVWSHRSLEHLELLIDRLRPVSTVADDR